MVFIIVNFVCRCMLQKKGKVLYTTNISEHSLLHLLLLCVNKIVKLLDSYICDGSKGYTGSFRSPHYHSKALLRLHSGLCQDTSSTPIKNLRSGVDELINI